MKKCGKPGGFTSFEQRRGLIRTNTLILLRKLSIFVFLLSISMCPPLAILAQQQSSPDHPLSDTQKIGQRLFQQRCSVCHIPPALTKISYGLRLYKDSVEGNEDFVREYIVNGREGFMPGWKYTLGPDQINDIIEYLKTIERPKS